MGRAKARPITGREAAPKQKRSQREALLTPVRTSKKGTKMYTNQIATCRNSACDALHGNISHGRASIDFKAVLNPSDSPNAPAYRLYGICPYCPLDHHIGDAWLVKEGQRSALRLVFNSPLITINGTFYADPNSNGGFSITPRRKRRRKAA
jgi:uncharacterized protein (DUF736 family)